MGAFTIWDRIAGFVRFIRKQVRERGEAWERYAVEHPLQAAERLDGIATAAKARSRAFRNQDGWRARLWRERANALAEHAEDLRRRAAGRACRGEPTREPGT